MVKMRFMSWVMSDIIKFRPLEYRAIHLHG